MNETVYDSGNMQIVETGIKTGGMKNSDVLVLGVEQLHAKKPTLGLEGLLAWLEEDHEGRFQTFMTIALTVCVNRPKLGLAFVNNFDEALTARIAACGTKAKEVTNGN